MKKFTDFLLEFNVTVPKRSDTLGVRRIDMPQVRARHMQDFLAYMRKNEASVKKIEVDPKQLKAIQGEFDKDKIQQNIEKLQKDGSLKPIIISKDNYVIDGNHRWLAAMNAGEKIQAYKISIEGTKLLRLTNKYPNTINKAVGESFNIYEALDEIIYENETCPVVTPQHMKAFEKIVDRLFAKFNVDFDFTRHFRERMSDGRNNPCIDIKELATIIQKIYAKKKAGGNFLSQHKDTEIVLKDIQSDLNIPIAIEYDRRNDELRVVAKTIMRKSNFRTPNPVVRV
jgi:disulfide oxidoreductase YuzD